MIMILNVPDMMCEKCVARINKALDEAAVKHTVSLDEKTVEVEEEKAEEAIEALEDIGFFAFP